MSLSRSKSLTLGKTEQLQCLNIFTVVLSIVITPNTAVRGERVSLSVSSDYRCL